MVQTSYQSSLYPISIYKSNANFSIIIIYYNYNYLKNDECLKPNTFIVIFIIIENNLIFTLPQTKSVKIMGKLDRNE